jgi:hypothetical protein
MRSKLRASRVVAATAVVAALAGGGVVGQSFAVTAVAGAQTGNNQPPGGHGPKLDAAAQALNLSVDDLRSKLDNNKTLAQVAQDQGVDVQKVIDAMVADATAHIDQDVRTASSPPTRPTSASRTSRTASPSSSTRGSPRATTVRSSTRRPRR